MSNKKVASNGAILAASVLLIGLITITHYDTPLDVNADFR